jgi:hypothetical protein
VSEYWTNEIELRIGSEVVWAIELSLITKRNYPFQLVDSDATTRVLLAWVILLLRTYQTLNKIIGFAKSKRNKPSSNMELPRTGTPLKEPERTTPRGPACTVTYLPWPLLRGVVTF